MPATSKVCTACGTLKALDAFDKNPQGALGRQSRCKVCRRKATAPKSETPEPKKAATESNGHLSLLEAAAHALAEASEPMTVGALTEKVIASGLWNGKGKTPSQTLSAQIQRELKGDKSRFTRAGRGLFVANGDWK